jgi:hypothetical protein
MIQEDPTIFLQDFGVAVDSGLASGLGILDMPTEVMMNDMVLSTDYSVKCETSKFGILAYGAPLTVAGEIYNVREVRRLDDGVFCLVTLERPTDPDSEIVINGDGIFDQPAPVTTEAVVNGDWV